MKTCRSALVLVLGCWSGVVAQNRNKVDINTETPEGQMLQQIGAEQDQAKKIAMMEEFLGKYASHSSVAWVLGQLHAQYLKANQFDKVFPVAEKLVAFDASDAEMAYGGLQAAVAKNDPAMIIKWADVTAEAARKGAKTPKPADEDELPRWEYKVKFSEQVQDRCEYEILSAALRLPDLNQKIQMIEAMGRIFPQSKYTSQLDELHFQCWRQLNNPDKAAEVAANCVAKGTAGEDMLLFLANATFDKKDYDKTVEYSTKLVDLLKTKPVPQGADPAAWENKKKVSMAAGYFLKGMVFAGQNKWNESDVVLREALPFMEGNEALLGPTYFQLGLANYRLGAAPPGKKPDLKRVQDALAFNQKAAAIKGNHQAQAVKNVSVIRTQYGQYGIK